MKDLSYTPVWILYVEVRPGGRVEQPVPEGWTAFAYTLEGDITFGGSTRVGPYNTAVFEPAGEVVCAEVEAGAKGSARFILVAGTPLDQKVVQYGPFVLNSEKEVHQALMDYQSRSNGFERAEGWESEIGKTLSAA